MIPYAPEVVLHFSEPKPAGVRVETEADVTKHGCIDPYSWVSRSVGPLTVTVCWADESETMYTFADPGLMVKFLETVDDMDIR